MEFAARWDERERVLFFFLFLLSNFLFFFIVIPSRWRRSQANRKRIGELFLHTDESIERGRNRDGTGWEMPRLTGPAGLMNGRDGVG